MNVSDGYQVAAVARVLAADEDDGDVDGGDGVEASASDSGGDAE